MHQHEKWRLWWRWVFANAAGEVVGLSATLALGATLILGLTVTSPVANIFLAFAIAVSSGAIEATVVGLAQWWALHPWFPSLTRYDWWRATLVGALIAYVLGYLPSTLMDLGAQNSQTPVAEPPQWLVLLLAAGLGAVGGAVLSFAQWRVLRKCVVHAGWWIPANMLAWMIGMPIVFWGIDAAQKGQPLVQAILLFTGALFVMGAVVGAIHGLGLVMIQSYRYDQPT